MSSAAGPGRQIPAWTPGGLEHYFPSRPETEWPSRTSVALGLPGRAGRGGGYRRRSARAFPRIDRSLDADLSREAVGLGDVQTPLQALVPERIFPAGRCGSAPRGSALSSRRIRHQATVVERVRALPFSHASPRRPREVSGPQPVRRRSARAFPGGRSRHCLGDW